MSVTWATFDCYGTLIDWEGGVADALAPLLPLGVDRHELATRYIEIEKSIEGERYLPYATVLDRAGRALLAERGVTLSPDDVCPLPDSIHRWQPFAEVSTTLRALRERGVRLAILSNVDRDLIASSIRHLGVSPDLIITAEDARSYKPAPGHWRLFRERSGATVEETVHVGASVYHDMVPARALGYRTVLIARHGESSPAALRTIPDLSRLRETIQALDGARRS